LGQADLVTITQVEDIVAPAAGHPHWIRPRNITHGSLTTIAPDRKEHPAAAVSEIGTTLIDNAHRISDQPGDDVKPLQCPPGTCAACRPPIQGGNGWSDSRQPLLPWL
jgi:hypothetical protein